MNHWSVIFLSSDHKYDVWFLEYLIRYNWCKMQLIITLVYSNLCFLKIVYPFGILNEARNRAMQHIVQIRYSERRNPFPSRAEFQYPAHPLTPCTANKGRWWGEFRSRIYRCGMRLEILSSITFTKLLCSHLYPCAVPRVIIAVP